jgi:hypothetical protein
VGISLYHWGSKYPWGDNELPEQGKFANQLTGNYVGANGNDSLLPDFYQIYGETHYKPVAIPETAALFAPDAGGEIELAMKQVWWSQLFDPATATRFPQLKMINWFEWDQTGCTTDHPSPAHPATDHHQRADLTGSPPAAP